jgi:DNA-binding IclR family transcriptional regulator
MTSKQKPAQKTAGGGSDNVTGTVARAVRVLRALADFHGDVGLKELAEHLDLPPSTVHRLLDLLAAEGMVERDEAVPLYRPGLEYYRVAASIYNRMSPRSVALPFLRQAATENDENAYLALVDLRAGKMVFAAAAESSHLLSYRVVLNETQSLVTGASGLAILAWMKDDDRERVITDECRGGPMTAASARLTLDIEIPRIHAQGYALTSGQRIKGAVGIFAPVFDAHGNVIGSLGYTVPEVRYKLGDLTKLSGAAMRHAASLSHALGYSGNDGHPGSTPRHTRGSKIGKDLIPE